MGAPKFTFRILSQTHRLSILACVHFLARTLGLLRFSRTLVKSQQLCVVESPELLHRIRPPSDAHGMTFENSREWAKEKNGRKSRAKRPIHHKFNQKSEAQIALHHLFKVFRASLVSASLVNSSDELCSSQVSALR